MKSKKKDLKLVTAILIAVIAIIIVGWAVINPGAGGASNSTQVIMGLNWSQYTREFSPASATPLLYLAAENNIGIYGTDAIFGSTSGANGLSFAKSDSIVPTYVDKITRAGGRPVLPVSSYNRDARLKQTYAYFTQKGWISSTKKWIYFDTEKADELRARDDAAITASNNYYAQFHRDYPNLIYLTTATRKPVLPGTTLTINADMYMPSTYDHYIERNVLGAYKQSQIYAWKILGFYEAGSLAQENDPIKVEPDYVKVATKVLKLPYPTTVPNFSITPEAVIPWVESYNGVAFLHWDLLQWLKKDASGNPVPGPELIKLLSGRTV